MTMAPTTTRLALLAAGAALTVAACGGGGDDSATPTTRPPIASTSTTVAGATGTAPLTGLPIDPAKAARPALVVKIDNAPKARPQAGLNQADVVVEEAVEGGVTRFATVFHSQDAESVGPIRSARSTDILFAAALKRPLFAYSGANAVFEAEVGKASMVNVGFGVAPVDYRREKGRPAPYNLFSSTPKLFARAPAGAAPPPPLFVFRAAGTPTDAAGAAPAAGVDMAYRGNIVTAVSYAWDAGTGSWKRSENGTAHVDAAGVQVAPRNVVVQFVTYKDTGLRDRSGAPVPEALLVGEGEAWIFTDGKVVKGRWKKATPEAVTEYLDSAGRPVRLTPGQSFVELPQPGAATVKG